MSNTKLTPKASLVFKNVDPKLNLADKTGSTLVTLKHKVDSTTLGLTFTDATARNVSSLKDVVATVEQRFGPKYSLNGSYALDTKFWKAGMSWEGKVAQKKVTLKSTFNSKDSKVTSEAKVILKPHHYATVTFDKFQATTAKYSILQGDITYEPSYNFLKKGFAVSCTKKRANQSYKLSYDFQKEEGSLEWSKRPYKITVAAPVSHTNIGKATVALSWEQDFLV